MQINATIYKLMNNIINNFLVVFYMVIAFVLMNVVYQLTYNNIFLDVFFSLLIVMFLLLALRVHKQKTKADRNFKTYSFSEKYLVILFLIIIATVIQFISAIYASFSPHEFNEFIRLAFVNGKGAGAENGIFNVVDTLLFAPIFEETIFRFLLFNYLKTKFKNVNYCVFISAFYFGLFHILSFISSENFHGLISNYMFWIYFLIKIIFGYFFAKSYQKTDNIFINIFLHSYTNLIALFL